jgi:hypothetical protein
VESARERERVEMINRSEYVDKRTHPKVNYGTQIKEIKYNRHINQGSGLYDFSG